MKYKKKTLKKLGLPVVLASLLTTSLVSITSEVHAKDGKNNNNPGNNTENNTENNTGNNTGNNTDNNSTTEEERILQEVASRIEERKPILKNITKINIKDKTIQNTTENLFVTIPVPLLEMYELMGGQIRVISGELSSDEALKKAITHDTEITDLYGEKQKVNDRDAYALSGDTPVMVINAGTNYSLEAGYEKRREVLYEVGKLMVKNVLDKTNILLNPDLLESLNSIHGNGIYLFTSTFLTENAGKVTEELLKKNKDAVQDILAKTFAYYYEIHSRQNLKNDAPSMYEFMRKKFETEQINDLKDQLSKEVLPKLKSEAFKWGQKNYGQWSENLTSNERRRIIEYTGTDYTSTNTYLRQPEKILTGLENLKNRVDTIDEALKKAVTSEDIIVYRRVAEPAFGLSSETLRDKLKIKPEEVEKFKNMFTNKTITDKAYGSTTLVPLLLPASKAAISFSAFPIVLQIKVPKGTHAAFLGDISDNKEEAEMLLTRGYSYKVEQTAITTEFGREYLKVYATLVNNS
ncbi:ADP-ribosyltransferase [Bacillus mycoides]|uniref:ADP-ribosyltransferase n=1 Tax=Bacillus mycoides TaxID=1405 RepID=UPI00380D3D38